MDRQFLGGADLCNAEPPNAILLPTIILGNGCQSMEHAGLEQPSWVESGHQH